MRDLWRNAVIIMCAVMSLPLTACTSSGVLDEAPNRNPAWSAKLPRAIGEARAAQVVGAHVVVSAKGGVAVLGRRSGEVLWHQRRHGDATKNSYDTFVATDSVIMTEYAASGGEVRILDMESGEQRKIISTAGGEGSIAVTATAVLTVDCAGPDDCSLAATDSSSGAQRWKNHLDQATQIAASPRQAPYLRGWFLHEDPLLASSGTALLLSDSGKANSTTILDISTGKRQGSLQITGSGGRFVSDDVYLQWTERKRCTAKVSGSDLSRRGTTWTVVVGRWEMTDSSPATCLPLWAERVIGGVLLAMTPSERPLAVDVQSGAAMWTGEKGFYPVGYADKVLVLRGDRGRGDVIAVDVDRGKEIWRLRAGELEFGAGMPLNAAVTGSGLTYSVKRLTDDGGTRLVLSLHNLRTGKPRWVAAGSNQLLGIGDDWIVSRQPSGGSNVVRLFDA